MQFSLIFSGYANATNSESLCHLEQSEGSLIIGQTFHVVQGDMTLE